LPDLQKAAAARPDCELVTVLVKGTPDQARTIAARQGLTAPILDDRKGAVRGAFGVERVPTTVVLDRDGRAVSVLIGGQSEASLAKAIRRGY
jgi:thioredoxin-like negative regulator of GroEL